MLRQTSLACWFQIDSKDPNSDMALTNINCNYCMFYSYIRLDRLFYLSACLDNGWPNTTLCDFTQQIHHFNHSNYYWNPCFPTKLETVICQQAAWKNHLRRKSTPMWPISIDPDCGTKPRDTCHLFRCSANPKNLHPIDLWKTPLKTTRFLGLPPEET